MRSELNREMNDKAPPSVQKVEVYRSTDTDEAGNESLMEMIIEAAINEILESLQFPAALLRGLPYEI